MRRYFYTILLALALIPGLATASTTWVSNNRVSTATTTTGSETGTPPTTTPCPSPATAADQGKCLAGMGGFTVHVESIAGAMTAGGFLAAYLWNPSTEQWNPAPDLNLYVTAVVDQSFAGFSVVSPVGGIAYLPSGVGVGVVITVYATGSR